MKKASHILEDLGFKKEAPESTKKAVLKYLFSQLSKEPIPIQDAKGKKQKKSFAAGEQLSFDFLDFKTKSSQKNNKPKVG